MQVRVSDLVHYWPPVLDSGERSKHFQPNAAIVTRVNDDGTVNLHVFHSGEGSSAGGRAVRIPHRERDDGTQHWSHRPRPPLTDTATPATPATSAASETPAPSQTAPPAAPNGQEENESD